ncbi:hypothetical protein [Sphingomonas koreensis]|nr:hypothetical protein [Sphingomonas koreensis]MDC7810967.1 hypothetical protein [Sphingomonas koreensis]
MTAIDPIVDIPPPPLWLPGLQCWNWFACIDQPYGGRSLIALIARVQ